MILSTLPSTALSLAWLLQEGASAPGGFPAWAWPFLLGAVLVLAVGSLVYLWNYYRGKLRRAERLFVDNPEAMVLTDTQWKIVDANEAACMLFGYSREQISLLTLRRLIHTEEKLDPSDIIEALKATPTVRYEATVVQEGKGLVDLAASTQRIELNGQRYLLTAFHNITAQKEDARIFRDFHERLVDRVPMEVGVMTPNGQYLYINPMASGGNPTVRDALIGNTDIEFCQHLGLHPEIALRRRSYRREAIEGQKLVVFEEILPGQDGELRYITRMLNPIVDADGEVTAIVSYGIDHSELERHKEQVGAALEEAERISMIKDSFLSSVGNEFKIPLTAILEASEAMEGQNGDIREFAHMIHRKAQRLMTTLSAMIDLSRLQSEFFELKPQVRNLVTEVKEVGRVLAPMAKEKGLYLRMRATKPEILVRVDQNSLFRVLENLIANAIKFTDEGGVLVEVDQDHTHVHVRVMDSGVGMRNDFLPHLYDEFNQENQGPLRRREGIGIGLSVSKRLLDLMSGFISVNTEVGEGSMFTISLPAAFPHVEGQEAGGRRRVLVVDDNAETRKLIAHVLGDHFEVNDAADFDAALDKADDVHYDVVLLDIEIDKVSSAAEVLMPFRDLPGYESVAIIALNPHALPGGEEQFLQDGYNAVLSKPLDRQQLLDKVGDVLARSMQEQEVRALSAVAA